MSRSPASRRQFLASGARAGAGALLGSALSGCARPGAVHTPVVIPPVAGVAGPGSLRSHAASRGLLAGCAVSLWALQTDPAYAALVREQAGIVVAENGMKWVNLRPTVNTFDFERADRLIAFAEANHMKVRGHTLCWHRQLPAWFATEVTPNNARSLLVEHIMQVAGRYVGRMHSWDVVNEAVYLPDGRPDGLRAEPWLRLIGEDYIEVAFHTARRADPQALLTYNDYGIEGEDEESQAKRTAVLLLLRRLKARDVPVDAMGIQSHIACGTGPKFTYGAGLQRFLDEVRELGLQVFLTEMDVNDRALPPASALRDRRVAEVYGSYLDMMLADPNVTAVLTWGITDKYSWLNGEDARVDHLPERCLPFEADLRPAPAFFAMRKSFDGRRGAA